MKGKRVPGLHRSAPADEMIQLALATQLKAMCALRKRAMNEKDPEGVHDMRVLSRRLRSAVTDFEPYIRKHHLSLASLRTLAKSLGAVRDEDVAIAALERLKEGATGEALQGIESLEAERRQRRKLAFEKLEKTIKPSSIKALRENFLAGLAAIAIRPLGSRSKTEGPTTLFGQVASDVVKHRLEEFRSAAKQTIYRPAAVTDLHELRILAKRLRYAIELTSSGWGKPINELAREVALLQTSLGELHDCDDWIEQLGARLKEAVSKGQDVSDARDRAAAVWLLKQFAKERTEHYRYALERWEEWESRDFLDSIASLYSAS